MRGKREQRGARIHGEILGSPTLKEDRCGRTVEMSSITALQDNITLTLSGSQNVHVSLDAVLAKNKQMK